MRNVAGSGRPSCRDEGGVHVKRDATRGIRPPGRKRGARLLAILIFLLPLRIGAAQEPSTSTPADVAPSAPPRRLPLAFSFSGGISLGAYQAGVSWAVIEFVKKLRDDRGYRDGAGLPLPNMMAMSGASAGTINVLLGSVQYCDTAQRREDESLLWQMWVHTGWNDLAPAHGPRDPTTNDHGILDRGSVRERVLPALESAMRAGEFRTGCAVALGVVTTQLAPGVLSYDSNIHVRNQRFVTLFKMREAGGRLRLEQPDDSLLADPRFGQQLALPVEPFGTIDPARVFSVIVASSAYPVAFAPELVEYKDPSCVLHTPVPPGCNDTHRQMFLDGGVFDNNPVSLALGMERKLGHGDSSARIVYVDPDALRGALRAQVDARKAAEAELRDRGIAALGHFGSGFILAARQYELQAFIRASLGEDSITRPRILSSTRGHHVVGEYFNAFGAFFGRPFREFDFYTGVADGMRFIAHEFLCDPTLTRGARPVARRDASGGSYAQLASSGGDAVADRSTRSAALDACTTEQTAWLAANAFALSPVGRRVVRDVLVREFPTQEPTLHVRHLLSSREDSAHYTALAAVEHATDAQLHDARPFACHFLADVPAWLLCQDGFGRVLDSLARDREFAHWVRQAAESPPCRTGAATYDPARCPAERILEQFVSDPHDAMQGIVDDLLNRARVAEEEIGREGGESHKLLVKTVEFLYRSIDHQARRGLDLDPSSIPPHDDWYWEGLHLLPFYVGGTVGNAGTVVGWQPAAHFGAWHLAAAAPFELSRLPKGYSRDGAFSWYGALSPSVGRDFGLVLLNQVFVGARGEFDLGADHGVPWFRRRSSMMPEASLVAVANKLRLSVYRVPARMSFNHRPLLRGTIALADLNGVLYWLAR